MVGSNTYTSLYIILHIIFIKQCWHRNNFFFITRQDIIRLSIIWHHHIFLYYLYYIAMDQGKQGKSLVLYTHFRSSSSWRVRIALNLKGIPHSFSFVNLIKGQQKSQDYKSKNANGLPTGQVVIQSMTICEYLEQVYPKIPLLPKDPAAKAEVRGFCEIINSGIAPYLNLRRLLQDVSKENQENRLQFAKFSAIRGMGTIETCLKKTKGKYCFGDEITLADVFLIPTVEGATHKYKVQLATYPNIQQVFENLIKLQAFKQAKPKNQPDYEEHQK